jgi:uncharacterized protein YbaR (Trm112 family)
VFIELTDQLRCPADHAESFLVLLPDVMEGRHVVRGVLGCPVCNAQYPIAEGVVQFGGSGPADEPRQQQPLSRPAGPDAGAIQAFLGIEGPGGYVGLVGDASRFAQDLLPLLPGVHLVAVNPPMGTVPSAQTSVLMAGRMPVKARALRGVVLGKPQSADADWQARAIQAVLPGLRATGEGPAPAGEGFVLLGEADGWWVGRTTG